MFAPGIAEVKIPKLIVCLGPVSIALDIVIMAGNKNPIAVPCKNREMKREASLCGKRSKDKWAHTANTHPIIIPLIGPCFEMNNPQTRPKSKTGMIVIDIA